MQRRQGQNIDTLSPIIVLSKAASQKVCAFPSEVLLVKRLSPPLGFFLKMNIKNSVGSEMMRNVECRLA